MRHAKPILLALAGLLALPAAASATFIGNTVRARYEAPLGSVIAQTNVHVAAPGTQAGFLVGFLNLEFGPDTITLTSNFASDFPSTGAFNGLTFADAYGTLEEVAGVSILASNMAGLSGSDLAYDAEGVAIDLDGLGFLEDTFVTLKVDFIPTPEPGAALLAGLGLLGLGALGRRRRA